MAIPQKRYSCLRPPEFE